MKVSLFSMQPANSLYTFNIEHDGKVYKVKIYVNDKGKFIDESISLNDIELEGEGTEGEIREMILTYLDENWDEIT